MFVPLREFINDNTINEEDLNKLLRSFSCAKDTDIESFISSKAVEFENLDKSRTYLYFDENDLDEGEKSNAYIKGYFSVALKVIVFPEEFSVRTRKQIDGYRGKIHGMPINEVPCYLIGQLGRDDRTNKEVLSGKSMLKAAMAIIEESYNAVGGRYVMVECRDDIKLKNFYEENGFEEFLKLPYDNQPMVQMIRRLEY